MTGWIPNRSCQPEYKRASGRVETTSWPTDHKGDRKADRETPSYPFPNPDGLSPK